MSAPATASAGTPLSTTQVSEVISGARDRIDDLDARIIALVRERMSVSAEIQNARIASGGRRVNLTREMEVLRTYGDALGRSGGTQLAMTLLELSRGRI
ncbi:chorismate mutase [Streptomyces sodiiphilus]|uniref:Chorismate mutase n=1 Tax=Streptomyces sodiiphilus TaxID=226217 RepID=A0ABN2PFS1_9ACTN